MVPATRAFAIGFLFCHSKMLYVVKTGPFVEENWQVVMLGGLFPFGRFPLDNGPRSWRFFTKIRKAPDRYRSMVCFTRLTFSLISGGVFPFRGGCSPLNGGGCCLSHGRLFNLGLPRPLDTGLRF